MSVPNVFPRAVGGNEDPEVIAIVQIVKESSSDCSLSLPLKPTQKLGAILTLLEMPQLAHFLECLAVADFLNSVLNETPFGRPNNLNRGDGLCEEGIGPETGRDSRKKEPRDPI